MAFTTGNDWSSDGKKGGFDEPLSTNEEFEHQQGKPVKALIGLILLVVLAVALARMSPAPHEVFTNPAMTTGQTTGSGTR